MGEVARRAKGYRRDPLSRRAQKDARLLMRKSAGELPDSASLEAYEHPILDQSDCGSCTGHGTAQGVYVALAAQGEPLGFFPSPRLIYALARGLDRAITSARSKTLPTLEDVGAYPSDAMRAITEFGVVPMEAPSPLGYLSDCDASNVLREPDLGTLARAGRKLIAGEYRIDHSASDFIDQVCHVLAFGSGHGSGAPVGIGVFVDAAFEAWQPSEGPIDSVNLLDPDGGGHWLAVTSYRTLPSGERVFRGPNSWSDQWGDAGHFEATESWLRMACSDCYPLTVRVS